MPELQRRLDLRIFASERRRRAAISLFRCRIASLNSRRRASASPLTIWSPHWMRSKECPIFCDCPFNPFRLHIAMIVVAPGERASFPDDRCSNAIDRPGSVNKLSGFVEEAIV